ncbi:hypothetical protein B0H19DRAFT_578413 [Mycena capillaripes]|nr:hypothetical protein B0H19DRAFT_578413 [Mycena capillaripes]
MPMGLAPTRYSTNSSSQCACHAPPTHRPFPITAAGRNTIHSTYPPTPALANMPPSSIAACSFCSWKYAALCASSTPHTMITPPSPRPLCVYSRHRHHDRRHRLALGSSLWRASLQLSQPPPPEYDHDHECKATTVAASVLMLGARRRFKI